MRQLRAFCPAFPERADAGHDFILITRFLPRPFVTRKFFVITAIDRQRLEVIDILDHHIPFGKGDDTAPVSGSEHRSAQDSHFSVLINKRDTVLFVNMLRRKCAVCLDAGNIVSEKHRRERQRIHAEIQKRAACQHRVRQSLHAPDRVGQLRTQHDRISDHAAVNYFTDRLGKRHVSRPHRFRDEYMFLLRKSKKLTCLSRVYAERFFDDHRLSVLNTELRVRIVLGMRRRDINQADLFVIHQLLVGAVCLFEAMFCRESGCLISTAGSDSIAAYTPDFPYRIRHCRRDIAGTHDRKIDSSEHTHLPGSPAITRR